MSDPDNRCMRIAVRLGLATYAVVLLTIAIACLFHK